MRVKRIVRGDDILHNSLIRRSVVKILTHLSACSGAVIAKNKILTAVHCFFDKNIHECQEVDYIPEAIVNVNGENYACISYSLNKGCFDPHKASNSLFEPKDEFRNLAIDAIICTTNRNIKNAIPIRMMSKDNFIRFYENPIHIFRHNHMSIPNSVMVGRGTSGSKCDKELTDFKIGWYRYTGLVWYSDNVESSLCSSKISSSIKERDYLICPGDSGAPYLLWNPVKKDYELAGVVAAGSLDGEMRSTSLMSESAQSWLRAEGILPYEGKDSFNFLNDSSVKIPDFFTESDESVEINHITLSNLEGFVFASVIYFGAMALFVIRRI